MNIMVLNIPRNLKDEDLAKLFKPYGLVSSCEIVMDKEKNASKGFGFVEMSNEDEAQKAIEELHGKKVGNQNIRVKASNKE